LGQPRRWRWECAAIGGGGGGVVVVVDWEGRGGRSTEQASEQVESRRGRKRIHTYEVATELDARSLPAAAGLPWPRLLARSIRNGVRRGEEKP